VIEVILPLPGCLLSARRSRTTGAAGRGK
jgi:hypothetical protein